MTPTQELEEELRASYRRLVDGVHLDDVDLDELIDPNRARIIALTTVHRRSSGRVWMAVAAATVLILGAGLALIARQRDASTDQIPATQPDIGSAANCPETAGSSNRIDAAIASAGPVLLPAETPVGFCAHRVVVDTSSTPQRYTVWSSCADCTSLTSSVALVRHGDAPDTAADRSDAQDFGIAGRDVRYYPAFDTTLATSLVSRDGLEPGFRLMGWGVDRDTLTTLASALNDGVDVPTVDGLVPVFDGEFGALDPGLAPADVTVQIEYNSVEPNTTIRYAYQHGNNASVDLAGYAWSTPNATFTTIGGHPAITSTAPGLTSVVIKIDDHSIVSLRTDTYVSTPVLTVDDLTAIELTIADPTDPRWAELTTGSPTGTAGN